MCTDSVGVHFRCGFSGVIRFVAGCFIVRNPKALNPKPSGFRRERCPSPAYVYRGLDFSFRGLSREQMERCMDNETDSFH